MLSHNNTHLTSLVVSGEPNNRIDHKYRVATSRFMDSPDYNIFIVEIELYS